MKINIEDIIIPEIFKACPPNKNKLQKCRENYNKGILDRKILIDKDNMLHDGYVLYTVLKEAGVKEVEVIQGDIYIWGTHPNNRKKYCWRIKDIGFKEACSFNHKNAIVDTVKGLSPIFIKEVFFSENPPVDTEIKEVIKLCGC